MLGRDPEDRDEDEEPATPNNDGLRRFIEKGILPWSAQRRKEPEIRPLIQTQAIGEVLDSHRFDNLARYETHLDRNLERTPAMLLKLKDLRREADAA